MSYVAATRAQYLVSFLHVSALLEVGHTSSQMVQVLLCWSLSCKITIRSFLKLIEYSQETWSAINEEKNLKQYMKIAAQVMHTLHLLVVVVNVVVSVTKIVT